MTRTTITKPDDLPADDQAIRGRYLELMGDFEGRVVRNWELINSVLHIRRASNLHFAGLNFRGAYMNDKNQTWNPLRITGGTRLFFHNSRFDGTLSGPVLNPLNDDIGMVLFEGLTLSGVGGLDSDGEGFLIEGFHRGKHEVRFVLIRDVEARDVYGDILGVHKCKLDGLHMRNVRAWRCGGIHVNGDATDGRAVNAMKLERVRWCEPHYRKEIAKNTFVWRPLVDFDAICRGAALDDVFVVGGERHNLCGTRNQSAEQLRFLLQADPAAMTPEFIDPRPRPFTPAYRLRIHPEARVRLGRNQNLTTEQTSEVV